MGTTTTFPIVAATFAAIIATQTGTTIDSSEFQETDFETLLSHHVRTIVLGPPRLPNSTTYLDALPAWLSKLPVSIELWTRLGDSEMTRLKNFTEDNVKVAVLVPWSSISSRNSILKRIKKDAMFIPLVKWVFCLKSGESLSHYNLSDAACSIAVVKDKGNVMFPKNSPQKCAEETNPARELFPVGSSRGWSALRGKSFVVANKCSSQGKIFPPGNYNYPSIVAVMKALDSLNITVSTRVYTLKSTKPDQVSLDLMHGRFDMVVSGPIESDERYRYIFVSAVTECVQLKFFSQARSVLGFSVMAAFDKSRFLVATLFLSIVSIVILHTVERRLLKRAADSGIVFLFLVSAALNRTSPLPASRTHPKTVSLCVLWVMAMTCIGAYIQSALTSELSIPPETSAIDTISELEQLVDSGRILPCVRINDFGHMYIRSEADSLAISLHKALEQNPESCIGDIDGRQCFDRSSRGTHVFIDGVLGGIDLRNATKYGLAVSSEAIIHSCQAALVTKHFPYTQDLVRLSRLISESGLIAYEWRKESWEDPPPPPQKDANYLSPSFVAHYCLYLSGVLLSTTVFAVELFLRYWGQRYRNHQ